ncbi:MAG: hypothetical protein GF335_01860 [Candidatus Moranbacteria bacterium]|nr:hypothetical protein [Candidatus Moranbacteria bacterium]
MNKETPYNKEKIKQRLAVSGEHIVYRYGKDQVIKFPYGPIHLVDKRDSLNKIKSETPLIKKYFSDFIVAYEILFYQKNKQKTYCIIQDFVKGRSLKLKDKKNPQIKAQLKKLIKANEKMARQTGYVFEFFGIKNLFFHFIFKGMDNVFIVKDKIKLIDHGLISSQTKITRSFILRLFIRWAIKRQKKLLNYYK